MAQPDLYSAQQRFGLSSAYGIRQQEPEEKRADGEDSGLYMLGKTAYVHNLRLKAPLGKHGLSLFFACLLMCIQLARTLFDIRLLHDLYKSPNSWLLGIGIIVGYGMDTVAAVTYDLTSRRNRWYVFFDLIQLRPLVAFVEYLYHWCKHYDKEFLVSAFPDKLYYNTMFGSGVALFMELYILVHSFAIDKSIFGLAVDKIGLDAKFPTVFWLSLGLTGGWTLLLWWRYFMYLDLTYLQCIVIGIKSIFTLAFRIAAFILCLWYFHIYTIAAVAGCFILAVILHIGLSSTVKCNKNDRPLSSCLSRFWHCVTTSVMNTVVPVPFAAHYSTREMWRSYIWNDNLVMFQHLCAFGVFLGFTGWDVFKRHKYVSIADPRIYEYTFYVYVGVYGFFLIASIVTNALLHHFVMKHLNSSHYTTAMIVDLHDVMFVSAEPDDETLDTDATQSNSQRGDSSGGCCCFRSRRRVADDTDVEMGVVKPAPTHTRNNSFYGSAFSKPSSAATSSRGSLLVVSNDEDEETPNGHRSVSSPRNIGSRPPLSPSAGSGTQGFRSSKTHDSVPKQEVTYTPEVADVEVESGEYGTHEDVDIAPRVDNDVDDTGLHAIPEQADDSRHMDMDHAMASMKSNQSVHIDVANDTHTVPPPPPPQHLDGDLSYDAYDVDKSCFEKKTDTNNNNDHHLNTLDQMVVASFGATDVDEE